jgi:hypothetical protein
MIRGAAVVEFAAVVTTGALVAAGAAYGMRIPLTGALVAMPTLVKANTRK